MNIEGTYTLQATPEEVWHCLTDQQILRRAVPGVEQLAREHESRYAITMHIRQAPLMGLYQGHVIVTDQHYPHSYRLSIEGEGKQSKISGEGIVQLSRYDENTVVSYKGTLNPGKLATLFPPPLVQGAAKLLIQQFFTALAEHLRTVSRVETLVSTNSTHRDSAEGDGAARRSSIANGSIIEWHRVSPATTQQVPSGQRFEHEAELPPMMQLWIARARRFGFIAALVALVWVGTQIPKRLLPGGQ